MNKQQLRDFVKYNSVLFSTYKRIGSMVLRAAGRTLPIDEKKIFFITFGGRRYDDSPRAIYEEILKRPEFEDFTFVWSFVGDAPTLPGNPRIVRTDSPEHYAELLTARYWITNASVERGLSFKRKGQICVNTWHGTPLKHIGSDNNTEYGTRVPGEHERFDLLCAQGEFDREVFARVFRVSMDKVLISGLPRNDSILNYSIQDVEVIRSRLGIPEGKRVLLYTPTFREYERNSNNTPVLAPPINLGLWNEKLSSDWVLLVRAHYLLTEGLDMECSDFVRNVSTYEPLNDLYALADAMISDYSSTFFDYALLERPMFCFAYDYEEYAEKRGLYKDALAELPCSMVRDEQTLLEQIISMDYKQKCNETAVFRKKFIPNVGNASKIVVDEIVKRFLQ